MYSKTAARRPDVLAQFKEAAVKRPSDADFWEALGDLLASLEPAGGSLREWAEIPESSLTLLVVTGGHMRAREQNRLKSLSTCG